MHKLKILRELSKSSKHKKYNIEISLQSNNNKCSTANRKLD